MSNAEKCNQILGEIRTDINEISYKINVGKKYTRASKEEVNKLLIARRRIRLAMTKMGINWK